MKRDRANPKFDFTPSPVLIAFAQQPLSRQQRLINTQNIAHGTEYGLCPSDCINHDAGVYAHMPSQ